ncbi:MAG: hypothetical protein ACUVTL_00520 [Thermoproteota archaeon]
MRKCYVILALFFLAAIVFISVYVSTKDLPLSSSISSTSFVTAFCLSSRERESRAGDSKEWQHFYMIFAGRLEVGDSPERAFEEAAQECHDIRSIRPALRQISSWMKRGESLSRCLMKIDYGDLTNRKLSILVSSILCKDSNRACQIIKDFLRLLRKNDILSRERELVLKEGRFKATILAMTNAISVAILAGIFPLMQQLVSGSMVAIQNGTMVSYDLLWVAFLSAIISSSFLLSRGFRVSPFSAMTVLPILAYMGTYLLLKAFF